MKVRIPERIDLPYGYTVSIIQLDKARFTKAHGDTCWAVWEEGPATGGTIYLDKSRPLAKRMEDLDHELDHAYVDWKEHWRDIVKQRTSR